MSAPSAASRGVDRPPNRPAYRPAYPPPYPRSPSAARRDVHGGRLAVGAAYALVGLVFLLEALGAWTWSAVDVVAVVSEAAPVALVVVGVVVVLVGLRADRR